MSPLQVGQLLTKLFKHPRGILVNYIAQENKFNPLSVLKVTSYFNHEPGLTISRRTIAKYRDELKTPSSNKRNKIKI
jgi:RNA polymerase sigma-54 factor